MCHNLVTGMCSQCEGEGFAQVRSAVRSARWRPPTVLRAVSSPRIGAWRQQTVKGQSPPVYGSVSPPRAHQRNPPGRDDSGGFQEEFGAPPSGSPKARGENAMGPFCLVGNSGAWLCRVAASHDGAQWLPGGIIQGRGASPDTRRSPGLHSAWQAVGVIRPLPAGGTMTQATVKPMIMPRAACGAPDSGSGTKQMAKYSPGAKSKGT